MKTNLNCIPCFIRQALDAVRFVTSDEEIHETVLREVLKSVSIIDMKQTPPLMARHIHRIIRKCSGSNDPYIIVKKKSNDYALEIYPYLKQKIEESKKPFETACHLAIAGNIIDFGVNSKFDRSLINKNIEIALTEDLKGDIKYFQKQIFSAKKILYLADNAGEIVFDRLLLEKMPTEKVIMAVRGKPAINDATIEDAKYTKLTDIVDVIDNGTDIPGTVFEECSDKFKKVFSDADLIISKGQGNFESLSDTNKNIFFLLKAKCSIVSQHLKCETGDSVIVFHS